jgi:hypothetical protein
MGAPPALLRGEPGRRERRAAGERLEDAAAEVLEGGNDDECGGENEH